MKRIPLHKIWVGALAVLFASCANDDMTITDGGNTAKPILLSTTTDMVSITHPDQDVWAKSVNYNSQDGMFAPDNSIGIYVTDEKYYPEGTELALANYGYENIRGTIDSEGKITVYPSIGNNIYYPIEPGRKVAVMAYAPYSDSMTWDSLENGFTFSVKDNQSKTTDVIASDLIVGECDENPFRKEDEAVAISFSHALTKVTLHTDFDVSSSMLCDSIVIKVCNAPATGFIQARDKTISVSEKKDIVMATVYPEWSTSDIETKKVIESSAILIPTESTDDMYFEISLCWDSDLIPDKVYKASQVTPHALISEKALTYNITISDDDEKEEVVPDDDEDDWIIGSNK